MPELLTFLPCEKVIVDERGNVSLIVLLHEINAEIPAQTEIPKNAVTPKEWAIFSMWKPLPQDNGRSFEQAVQMLWPDGSEFKTARLGFRLEANKIHHNRMSIVGFPIGQSGSVTLNMWLEQNSKRVGELHSFILNVAHVRSSQ